MRKVTYVAVAVLAVCWMASPELAFAGAAISNGFGLYMGVNDEGHHNILSGIAGLPANSSFLGLATTFPDGSVRDATSPGCQCEGWGVLGGGISGFANVSTDGGAINLTVDSFTTSGSVATSFGALPTSATSSVHLTSLSDLHVTHVYAPSAATSALFEGTVTISNTGASTITGIYYRRVMDWDIPPDEFSEYVTHGGLPAANVFHMGNNGFATAEPLNYVDGVPGGLTIGGLCGGISPEDNNFIDCNGRDHGTVIDFTFGDLGTGESKTFQIFYGAAPTELDAFIALGAVGAEVYSLGQWLGDPTGGTPATYIFAFKGVGGTPLPEIPEPQYYGLLAAGLAAIYWVRRRRTA